MIRVSIFASLLAFATNHEITQRYTDDSSNLNSDINLNSSQLIMKYGYKSEIHKVNTEDGYIVTLIRLVQKGPPVLLVHGIGDSSDSWLVLGPASSLAYQLADAQFDVWLFNSRGNKYSKGDTKNFTAKEYWDFSYEEMGSKDLPATIDYILQETSNKKLTYVGFSQGTTILFVMCSLNPSYNDKINHAILLAPVAWVRHLQYPFITALSMQVDFLKLFFDSVGMYEIFAKNSRKTDKGIVCNNSVREMILCNIEYYINYGIKNMSNLPADKFDVIDSHIPAGTSTKTFAHFIQGYRNQQFQRFDYGLIKNLLIYSSPRPPLYDISRVTIPVSIIASDNDWFSNTKDIRLLLRTLPNVKRHITLNRSLDFTHIEFAYGRRVKSIVNDPVFKIILAERDANNP